MSNRLVRRYVKALIYFHHDTLRRISVGAGKSAKYSTNLLSTKPEELHQIIPYLSLTDLRRIERHDNSPVTELIKASSHTVNDISSFYRHIKLVALLEKGSLNEVSRLAGYRSAYLSTVLPSGLNSIKPICIRIAPILHISSSQMKRLLSKVTLHGRPIWKRHSIKSFYRHKNLSSLRQRRYLSRYIKLVAYLRHDSLVRISRRNGYNGSHINELLNRNALDTVIRQLLLMMPYLSRDTLDRVRYGSRQPFNKILGNVARNVNSRRNYNLYLSCLAISRGTTLAYISKRTGHTKEYIHITIMKGTLNNVIKVTDSFADYLSLDRTPILKLVKKLHLTSALRTTNPRHLNYDKQRIHRDTYSAIKEVAGRKNISVGQLSKNIFNDRRSIHVRSGYSIKNNYKLLKSVMAYTHIKPLRAVRLCHYIRNVENE